MPKNNSQQRLCTVASAAEYADCSTKTIRRYIAQGRITGYRLGPRMLRVDLDELDSICRPLATAGGASR